MANFALPHPPTCCTTSSLLLAGVPLAQQQVVLEYRMDRTVATADDPPVVLGRMPDAFVQQLGCGCPLCSFVTLRLQAAWESSHACWCVHGWQGACCAYVLRVWLLHPLQAGKLAVSPLPLCTPCAATSCGRASC